MPGPEQRQAHPAAGQLDETADADLVRLAKANPHAFAPLYLRYRDPILNYCFYRLGDHEDSEDAASVIFVKVLDHLPRFVERGNSFRTWLFRIAHNEITDRHRHRARHTNFPLDHGRGLPDPASPPEDAAISRDTRDHLRQVLAQLPPRERAVLELRTAELSTREIADVLRISEQGVRTAQSRAVSRLRGLLLGKGVAPAEFGDA